MPHFSFWTWPNPNVGPFDAVLDRIDRIEEATPWAEKIDKAVWRGTMWFSPIGNKDLRKALVRVGEGKEWADVEHVRDDVRNVTTGAVERGNKMMIEGFCRYKYVIYTDVGLLLPPPPLLAKSPYYGTQG